MIAYYFELQAKNVER